MTVSDYFSIAAVLFSFYAWSQAKRALSASVSQRNSTLALTKRCDALEKATSGGGVTYRDTEIREVETSPILESEESESKKQKKPFVSGQTVDVSFMDDGYEDNEAHYWFSATFLHFSDIEGETHVWLKVGDGEPASYVLAVTFLEHPEVS